MKTSSFIFLLLSLSALAQPSPYAGEQNHRIKALSDSDAAGYLAGKGMGLARAAELNRYPGPRHTLDLAAELQLTAGQIEVLQRLFTEMEQAAIASGKELVAREAELDHLFAGGRATRDGVLALTAEIGRLQGLIRAAHLNAHVAATAVLTREQVARYAALRGYDTETPTSAGHKPSGHHRG